MIVRRMQLSVRKEMAGKLKEGKLGFLGRCVRKRFVQMPSPSVAARSGSVISDRKRTSGRDGDAAGAARTSPSGRKGSTDRQSQRKQWRVHRDPRYFLTPEHQVYNLHQDVGIHTSHREKEFHVNSNWILSVFLNRASQM